MGGVPKHPVWYYNLKADPDSVEIQDGAEPFHAAVRESSAVTSGPNGGSGPSPAYPPYAEYQTKTDRLIPVFVATRR